ncbi:MAG TPA: RidA family protein [Dongiaceae bacterium]|nr:RidA family protein [Dongiaceae bacterium]
MVSRIPNPFIGTFSDAVSVEMGEHTTIHVSGQVGNDASGKVTAKSFEEEARVCLANVAKVLEKAGAGMKDVVRITAYMTDLADYPAYSKARGEAFKDAPPASATVQVAGLLADARLEIDAVAVIKTRRG